MKKSRSRTDSFRDALPDVDGFRPIRDGDASSKLLTGEPLMDRFSLSDYVAWNKNTNSLVIVRVNAEDQPNAAAWISVEDDVVTLEMVGRDRGAPPGFLGIVMRMVERAAVAVGCKEIRLDAISHELVSTYEAKGYEKTGPAYTLNDWPTLIPMRKRL